MGRKTIRLTPVVGVRSMAAMPGPVAVLGTPMFCDMGFFPSVLIVEPLGVFANDLPAGTILDIIPEVNIPSFGLCHSPLNPEVIALTAAALGVPVPAPCIPIVVDPWISPSNVLIDGLPILTEGSVCECLWAGTIVLTGPSPAMNVEAI
jgi:hypothetical protein